MRRNRPEKRVVLPDPRYDNELVAHLINKIMLRYGLPPGKSFLFFADKALTSLPRFIWRRFFNFKLWQADIKLLFFFPLFFLLTISSFFFDPSNRKRYCYLFFF
jgi:hypothetical protein